MRPISRAVPKEMLPVGRLPVLERVVLELKESGIEEILFIISPGKEMIPQYFQDGSDWGIRCEYLTQGEMRGLGDAVLHGEDWTGGEPFVVAHGDTLFEAPEPPPVARMIDGFVETNAHCAVLCEEVSPERTDRYGIVDPEPNAPAGPSGAVALRGIVEKPGSGSAPSLLAVAARWCFAEGIFDAIREAARGVNGEVGLTQAAGVWIASGAAGWAFPLGRGERRCDIGGWESYLEAAARAALRDPEAGPGLRREFGLE